MHKIHEVHVPVTNTVMIQMWSLILRTSKHLGESCVEGLIHDVCSAGMPYAVDGQFLVKTAGRRFPQERQAMGTAIVNISFRIFFNYTWYKYFTRRQCLFSV